MIRLHHHRPGILPSNHPYRTVISKHDLPLHQPICFSSRPDSFTMLAICLSVWSALHHFAVWTAAHRRQKNNQSMATLSTDSLFKVHWLPVACNSAVRPFLRLELMYGKLIIPGFTTMDRERNREYKGSAILREFLLITCGFWTSSTTYVHWCTCYATFKSIALPNHSIYGSHAAV